MYPPAIGPITGPISGPRRKNPIALPRSWTSNKSITVLQTNVRKDLEEKKNKAYPAPTACVALAPVAWSARIAINKPTLFDKAQPIVEAIYKVVDSTYIMRRPYLSENVAQNNG